MINFHNIKFIFCFLENFIELRAKYTKESEERKEAIFYGYINSYSQFNDPSDGYRVGHEPDIYNADDYKIGGRRAGGYKFRLLLMLKKLGERVRREDLLDVFYFWLPPKNEENIKAYNHTLDLAITSGELDIDENGFLRIPTDEEKMEEMEKRWEYRDGRMHRKY